MSNIIQKVKEVISGDSQHPTDSTHRGTTTGTTGVGSTTRDTYGTGNTTAGPHRSDMANKVDPRVDSDRDGSHNKGTYTGTGGVGSGTGMAGGFGTHHGSTNYGPHDSNAANKLDPRVDSDHDGSRKIGGGGYSSGGFNTHSSTTHGTTGLGHDSTAPIALNRPHDGTLGSSTHNTSTHGSTNVGPHSSNLMNKIDPRVDSDRDGSRNAGLTGAGGVHSTTGSTTAGPHRTDIGNKMDPKVDSDRDGSSRFMGSTGLPGSGTHNTHTTTTSHGLGSSTHTTTGPHSSDLANKIDPRVDSDRDGSHMRGGTHASTGTSHNLDSGITGHGLGAGQYSERSAAYGSTTTGSGLTGTHNTSTNAGPHSSNVANKLDPRFDSDRDHRGATTGTTTTGTHQGTSTTGTTGLSDPHTGPAPHTAGPHKSDLLNKLDPRVDSDLDGSKTIGGNKTFSAATGTDHTHSTTGRYA